MALLSSPTADELIVEARNMLNQPDSTNSVWSDEELLVYLNEAIRRYFSEVVQKAEGQFTTEDDLNLVAGVSAVNLPSDCFSVKVVNRKVSGGYVPLAYSNNFTEGYATTGAATGDSYMPVYSFQKNQLILRPAPSASETDALRVEYVQFPESLITGSDSVSASVSPVFRDLLSMYMVYKAKLKESLVNGVNVHSMAEDNLKDLYNAFKEAIDGRSKYPSFIQPFDPENQ